MDEDDFIDPTPDDPVEATRFLSFLDLKPILAVLESFYCEPWRHRHPPEAMLRLFALYSLKRFRFPTELWRLLDDEALKAYGVELGLMVAGDASIIQALPEDTEAAYNGYYKMLCYLVHRLVCCVTNLTLTWAVTPGNVDETFIFAPLFLKAIARGVIPRIACFETN